MSEVIGYLLGFGMSFMLLMMAMFAFGEVQAEASEGANRALFRDVAGRVAAGVIEMTEIGRARTDSVQVTSSSYIVVKTLPIPRDVGGLPYIVTLAEKDVTVQDINGRYVETATTLNFDFQSYTGDNEATDCDENSYALCYMGGEARSGEGRILIKYEYDETPGSPATCKTTPFWNCISIS